MEEPTQPKHVLPVADAAALYKEFREKYVAALFREFREIYSREWMKWVAAVDKSYLSCCNKYPPEVSLNVPAQAGVDCQAVYDQFYGWAEELREWANSLAAGFDACRDDWAPELAVPDVSSEPCMDCEDAHARMHTFYSEMAAWGLDLRIAIDKCPKPGPNVVEGPPKFPC